MVYLNNKKFNVDLYFYLFSVKSIYQVKKFIKCWSYVTKQTIKKITLKQKVKLFTLIKSPHIFKKSKEQYNIKFFILIISIRLNNFSILHKMLIYVINNVDILFLKCCIN